MSRHAIIVDDNEENLYFLKTLLTNNGFETFEAREGATALKQAREHPPDIIISDVLMPVMDGFSLCRQWKQDPRLKHIPFVFYTATYIDEQDEAFALRLGADKFIIKPSEAQTFVALISEVLRKYQTGELTSRDSELHAEPAYLQEYNVVLIKKLEDKLQELATLNIVLTNALTEKETLLRELYHRTKNNLQVMASMFELQAEHSQNPAVGAALEDMLSRVKALALVQEKLYESKNLSRINLQEYLRDLAALEIKGRTGAPDTVRLVLDLEPCFVPIDTAMPCGLIINELFTNAIKHAFPYGRNGEIRLSLHQDADGQIELTVSDNGVGLRTGVDTANPVTLGLETTCAIAENQLKGSITFESEKGVRCVVRFKNPLCSPHEANTPADAAV